jgi:adenylate cyclase
MERLLGYDSGELFNLDVSQTYLHKKDREKFQAEIGKTGQVENYQAILRKKDGTPILCLISASAWDAEGRPGGYCGFIREGKQVTAAFKSFHGQWAQALKDASFFRRAFCDELLERVSQNPETDPFESGMRDATILTLKVRELNSLLTSLDAARFSGLMNDLLTDVMDLVYGHGGTVYRLSGEGFSAAFGCPISSGKDALRAAEAAMEIDQYLQTFNDVRPDYLRDPVSVGVGLASGKVFSGVMGSIRRQEYVVVGEAETHSAKLSLFSGRSGRTVLLDEATSKLISPNVCCTRVGQFTAQLSGEPAPLYGFAR